MNPKCSCTNCNGHIEFESTDDGRVVACPHCGWDTILSAPQPKPEAKPTADQMPAKTWLISLLVIAAMIVVGTLVYGTRNCLYSKPGGETTNDVSATTQVANNSSPTATALNDTNPIPSANNPSTDTPSPEKKSKRKKKKQ